jgi:NAD(P)-dependent dehydrogenase (short-subunit alcohol dehydrogenase family)
MAKVVLITGASTGIGFETASYLAKLDYTVIGTVRKQDDTAKLLANNIKPLILDVTNLEQVNSLQENVKKILAGEPLFALINNAGIAVAGPSEFLALSEFRKQFDVNFFAVIAITQTLIPLLAKQSRIIMMSSVSGIRTTPFLAPYSASKHALEAFSQALRLELNLKNIHVVRIRPGYIRTPIWDKSDELDINLYKDSIYFKSMEKLKKLSMHYGKNESAEPIAVAKCVEKILKAKKPKSAYRVTKTYIREHFVPTYFPKSFLDYVVKKVLLLNK